MPRKRKDPSLIEIAVAGRWTVAATLCGLCFVGGFLVIPGLLGSNAIYRPMASVLRMLATIPVIGFGCLAAFKFLRQSQTTPPRGRPDRPEFIARHPAPMGSNRALRAPVESTPFIVLPHAEPALPKAGEWSLALLQSIEWKRFEEVVAAYFRAKNFRCETIEFGPDGGVDGRLYFGDAPDAVGIVQCKAWGDRQVGVAPVRELLGVMSHEKVARGYFCATGEFSSKARSFAAANPIKLISGRDFLEAIAQMPGDVREHLLAVSTIGDYTTPTCPSCGIKLVARTIGGKAAWACRNFPRCKSRIKRKKSTIKNAVVA